MSKNRPKSKKKTTTAEPERHERRVVTKINAVDYGIDSGTVTVYWEDQNGRPGITKGMKGSTVVEALLLKASAEGKWTGIEE